MPEPSPAVRFFGLSMIAVGALMAFLSGACTLVFLTMGLSPKSQGGDIGMVWVSLGLGLPFVAIGIALVFGGRALARRHKPIDPPDQVF